MKWPWSKPGKAQDQDVTQAPEVIEARKARERSERELKKIRGRRAEVEGVANAIHESIGELRKKDQLAEMFEDSIKKGPEPHHG